MNKKLVYTVLMGLVIFGTAVMLLSLNKDLTGEETDFVNPAIAITQTGHPLFYQAEQLPNQLAVWHPPMYIYLLAIIIKFAYSTIIIRFLNVFFIFLTTLLIYYFSKKFFDKNGGYIGLIASALFLINNYVLSSAILIDIDALSTFFVFSFMGFVFLYFNKNNIFYALLAGFSFLFALSNRYPIAVITYVGILLCLLINKETRTYWKKYFIIGFTSSAVFLIIWTWYSTIIEPGTFFSFLIHNAELGSQQFASPSLYLSSFALNIAQVTRLFTLPVILLFILAAVYNFNKKDMFTRVILIYTLVIFIVFIFVPRPAFGYPRYFFTLMPGLFMLISAYIYNKISEIKFKKEYFLIGTLCFLACLILLLTLNPQLTLYRNDGLIKSTNLPDFAFNIACISPVFLAFMFKHEQRKFMVIICLIAALLSYNIYFDVKYLINDSHIKEVGTYLKENTNSTDRVLCPKAVGYYYGGRFYTNDYYKPPLDKISKEFLLEYIAKSYNNPEMSNQFFWGNDIYGGIYFSNYTQADKNLFSSKYVVVNYLSSNTTPEKIIGDYYIYRTNK